MYWASVECFEMENSDNGNGILGMRGKWILQEVPQWKTLKTTTVEERVGQYLVKGSQSRGRSPQWTRPDLILPRTVTGPTS